MNRRRLVLLPLLVVAALLLPLSSPGTAAPGVNRELTVMTRNLYLGSSLQPAIEATDGPSFVAAVATIYNTMLFTDFPTRAKALADEVLADRPDLIGLQEVSRWTTFGATTGPSLDFLTILQGELVARGLRYDVAAVSNNASIGPAPLFTPCSAFPNCGVLFEDRDVILVNTDRTALTVGNPRHGNFTAQQSLNTPIGPLSFARGWTTVDGTLNGRAFRFANTHLETEDSPSVQEAQAREFRAVVQAPRAVIAVGDFNSAADGSTTDSYAFLTQDYFRDAAPASGNTCCQNGTLTNFPSALTSRIDLVLTHGAAQPVSAHRVGADPFQGVPPLYPSDHAGVVATVRLP